MNIGFTGTRFGMTPEQRESFKAVMMRFHASLSDSFHHGDCIGADDQAANDAHENGIYIVRHPPVDETHRAFNPHFKEEREPKKHFARNRDIVDETEMLIACPQYAEPITKETMGGTAFTVTYARKRGKSLTIVRPDGSSTGEWNFSS